MREGVSKRWKMADMRKSPKRRANKHKGSSIDDLFKDQGVLEKFQARAAKQVIA